MHAIPYAFTGVLATMAGLNWIIERRMKLRQEQAAPKKDNEETRDE